MPLVNPLQASNLLCGKVPTARRQLVQFGRRSLASLSAFLATQPASEVVDRRGGDMGQGGEVDAPRRFAAGAPDLEPSVAAVDRLIDGWGRSIGPPSAHIRSFQLWQERLSASLIRASPAARFSTARSARIFVIARAFVTSLPSALRSPPDNGVG
jgi:hypothetical protein